MKLIISVGNASIIAVSLSKKRFKRTIDKPPLHTITKVVSEMYSGMK